MKVQGFYKPYFEFSKQTHLGHLTKAKYSSEFCGAESKELHYKWNVHFCFSSRNITCCLKHALTTHLRMAHTVITSFLTVGLVKEVLFQRKHQEHTLNQ